ncbi:pilus assembly protein [Massilia sp. B-10]|nr:pilus assembly protein [Massilia sp. B-10]
MRVSVTGYAMFLGSTIPFLVGTDPQLHRQPGSGHDHALHAMNTLPFPGRSRGAIAVEFSLTALLFFTLIFGALEFARVMYIHNTLQEVTRRAARNDGALDR